MALVGQFRDLADPDRFVWLRGFPDMKPGLKLSAASTTDRCGKNTALRPTWR